MNMKIYNSQLETRLVLLRNAIIRIERCVEDCDHPPRFEAEMVAAKHKTLANIPQMKQEVVPSANFIRQRQDSRPAPPLGISYKDTPPHPQGSAPNSPVSPRQKQPGKAVFLGDEPPWNS